MTIYTTASGVITGMATRLVADDVSARAMRLGWGLITEHVMREAPLARTVSL